MGRTRIGGRIAAAIGMLLVLGLVVGAPVGSGAAAAPASLAVADAAPGGPILVVTATGNKFTHYLAEILQAEGLNAYATADVSALDATLLADYEVVVLGETALTAGQVTDLTGWVNAGGNLIAMRPDAQLFGLLGVTSPGRYPQGPVPQAHDEPGRCRHRHRQHPVPRHGDPLHACRRDGGRDVLRDSDEIDRQPGGDAPLRRFQRR